MMIRWMYRLVNSSINKTSGMSQSEKLAVIKLNLTSIVKSVYEKKEFTLSKAENSG